MSKPYDAASKELLQMDPAAWAGFVGVVRPPDQVELTDSELSTVTAAADKVLLIHDPVPWILDIEFQSWRDPSAPRQLLKYNALLHERHECPVVSVLVVLAKDANSTEWSGRYPLVPPFGPSWEFGYTVVRVWETAADTLLTGPLALIPLAPVANVPLNDVPDVLRRMTDRVSQECNPETTDRLLTAVGLLLRLRYGPMTSTNLLKQFPEILNMEPFKQFTDTGRTEGRAEGRTEGRAEGLQTSVQILGREKFGAPNSSQETALKAITDPVRLEALCKKLLSANTWDELLAGA